MTTFLSKLRLNIKKHRLDIDTYYTILLHLCRSYAKNFSVFK